MCDTLTQCNRSGSERRTAKVDLSSVLVDISVAEVRMELPQADLNLRLNQLPLKVLTVVSVGMSIITGMFLPFSPSKR